MARYAPFPRRSRNARMTGLTFAVLAVALCPFAYWELGHLRGVSESGSSPWVRRAFVLAYLLAIVIAVDAELRPGR